LNITNNIKTFPKKIISVKLGVLCFSVVKKNRVISTA